MRQDKLSKKTVFLVMIM